MKSIAETYTIKRESSVQEAVYLIMPEVLLRKTFPEVMFLNSNLPEYWYRIFRRKRRTWCPTNIFQRNMLDRYTDRPDSHFQNGNMLY